MRLEIKDMQEAKKKERISQIAYICFYTGMVIEVLLVLIDKSAYTNPIEGQIFRLTFLLFLAKTCLTRYSKEEYLTIFAFCVLGGVSYLMTGRNEVLRLVIMIAAFKNVDLQKCLRLVFILTLSGCMVIILFSVTGIFGAVSLTQDYGRGNLETRYTLGMGHPNALHCMVWSLILLAVYLYGKKMKLYQFLGLMLINLAFFMLSDSRTSFLITEATILFAMMFRYLKKDWMRKTIAGIGCLAAAASIGISVLIAANAYRVYDYVWNGDRTEFTMLFVHLNEALNGRIRILVENDGFEGTVGTWSLFSRPENNYFFDMGWIRLFYWFGIIPACVFIIVLLALMIYCLRNQKYMEIVMIVSVSIYTIIEAHVISDYLARNYLFFLIGAYWCQLLPGRRRGKRENE